MSILHFLKYWNRFFLKRIDQDFTPTLLESKTEVPSASFRYQPDLKELRGGAKRNFFHDSKEFCCCGLYSVTMGELETKELQSHNSFIFFSK